MGVNTATPPASTNTTEITVAKIGRSTKNSAITECCSLVRLRAARIDGVLQLFGLSHQRDTRVKELSGGMRRRIEIAKALSHAPKILLLDEPTSGLDAQNRHQLWNYVKALNTRDGVTVLFTTHYLEEAEQVADRVAIIDHGRIAFQGSSQELRQQTGTESLEHGYLALTGANVRDEHDSLSDSMRRTAKTWMR
jgi:ABC-2 type transport system ATP-binding protein